VSETKPAANDSKQKPYHVNYETSSGPRGKITTKRKKRLFLKNFEATLAVVKSCEAAGVSSKTHYDWLASDPQYAREFAVINARTLELAEIEVFKRGVVGWDEPVYQGGVLVGTIRKKSDTCLLFLLKCKGGWNDRAAADDALGRIAKALEIHVRYEEQPKQVGPVVEHAALLAATRTEGERLELNSEGEEIANNIPETNDLDAAIEPNSIA